MRNRILKNLAIIVFCAALFYVLGEPFRAYLKLSPSTEVRPVCAFPYIFGIIFGFWGTFGCAIGNLISDIQNGYSWMSRVFGFMIQLIYGYIPAIIYNYLRRHDENKYRFDQVTKIYQYLLIITVDSFVCAALVWTLIHFDIGLPIFGLGFLNTLCNQFIFFIIVGIPMLSFYSIFLQNKKNKNSTDKKIVLFSLNEKFILFFISFSLIISILAGIAAYYIFFPVYMNKPMELWSYVFFTSGITLCILMIPSLLFLGYIEHNVSKPLERMSSSALNFGSEENINLEIEKIIMKCRKYVYFSTEIGDLARSYQSLAKELADYVTNLAKITAQEENTKTQLKIATDIQLGALPKPIQLENIELYASMKPALEVGGDFYDFFMIDEKHLAMVVADVSGKGVPAALFMMISKIILRKNLKVGMTPAEALTKTNQELCDNNPMDMFVTCLCGILDLDTYMLTFSNAGHEKPALAKKGQPFYFANIKSGMVLGGMPGIKYTDFQVQLGPGDIMFNYTDGIPEAMSPQNEEFGNDRLLEVLNKQDEKHKELEKICTDMKEAIVKFNDTAPQFDDITMLMFRIKE